MEAAEEPRRPLLEPVPGPSSGPPLMLLSCFTACLAAFSFGYTVGYTSPALPLMRRHLHLSRAECALFSSLAPLGAMPGALLAGPLAHSRGRKAALALASLLLALHWAAISLSQSFLLLLCARLLGGIGIGLASFTVPVYVAEVASVEWRGALGSCNQLLITLGTLSVYTLGLFWTSPPSWHALAAAGCVPAVLLLLGLCWIPESPRWLLRHSSVHAARHALCLLYATPARLHRQGVQGEEAQGQGQGRETVEEGGEIALKGAGRCSREGAGPWGRSEEAVERVLREMLEGAREEQDGSSQESPVCKAAQSALDPYAEGDVGMKKRRMGCWVACLDTIRRSAPLLLSRSLGLPILVSVVLMVVQQLGGINAIVFFSASIFQLAGFANPNLPSFVVALVQVFFTFIAAALMDRVGRRPLLLLSSLGMALSAFGLGLAFLLRIPNGLTLNPSPPHDYFHPTPTHSLHSLPLSALSSPSLPHASFLAPGSLAVLCTVAYIICFSLGMGPIPWLIMAEILPDSVKASAGSFVVLCNWFLCFLVTETFEALKHWSPHGVFWLYSCVCAVGALFIFLFVPETRNTSLEDIQDFFRRPPPSSAPC